MPVPTFEYTAMLLGATGHVSRRHQHVALLLRQVVDGASALQVPPAALGICRRFNP